MCEYRHELVDIARRCFKRPRVPPIGQVLRDFRKAPQLPSRIVKRCHNGSRPEARAVIAQAPSFALEAAMIARRCKLIPRLVSF